MCFRLLIKKLDFANNCCISDPQSHRVSCQNLCLNPLYINIDITKCVKTNTPILINKRPYKKCIH